MLAVGFGAMIFSTWFITAQNYAVSEAIDSTFDIPFIIPNIYFAVTRKNIRKLPEDGWIPSEKMSVDEAVKLFTKNAAYAFYTEEENRTIELGKCADFVVAERDIYVINPDEIKDSKVDMTILGGDIVYNHVSEYLGSHVFQLLDIPAQETYLGTYKGKNIVLMKNFCGMSESLVHFNDVGESTLEQDKELYQYSYEDIQRMLMENTKSTDVQETIRRFWDMFIVDALNGNVDRHGGNWGFIKKNGKYRMAPVYDNGSSMYPRLNTDELLTQILSSEEEIAKRVYHFPTSHFYAFGDYSLTFLQFP